ncbi:hypothetical protein GCM10007173_13500 [Glutamicibacter ardleyensis]|uniref:Helix-turn-helix domain-containing protein n=1 Tax=Glutamicibacter ardleyensis TaxID=225894 RepID=A0ABQ2DHW3_9MICC|nr:hypothetical protein GCM10007173_13500 [Glutamicibacter ardleyensis]
MGVFGLDEVLLADQAWRVARVEVARLAQLREEAVRAALEAGESPTVLGKELGISRQRVYALAGPKW